MQDDRPDLWFGFAPWVSSFKGQKKGRDALNEQPCTFTFDLFRCCMAFYDRACAAKRTRVAHWVVAKKKEGAQPQFTSVVGAHGPSRLLFIFQIVKIVKIKTIEFGVRNESNGSPTAEIGLAILSVLRSVWAITPIAVWKTKHLLIIMLMKLIYPTSHQETKTSVQWNFVPFLVVRRAAKYLPL